MATELKILEATVDGEIAIGFDEIPIPDGSLGEHSASKDGMLAGKTTHSATISSVSRKIEWGIFEGQPACLLGIDIYFSSTAGYSLKYGTYELMLKNTKEISALSTYMSYFRPEIFEGKIAVKNVSRSITASPNAGIAGAQVSIGNFTRGISYAKERAFKISGHPMAAGQSDEPLCKGIKWRMHENNIQKTGIVDHLRVAVLIRHDKKPFVIESRAEGKTGFSGEIAENLLRRKNLDQVLRIFNPPQDASQILELKDLEAFVAETLFV
jgi:hypothetical protein